MQTIKTEDLLDKLKEQLPSFEAACKMYDVPADKAVPDFEFFPERDREAMRKLTELVLIIRAANRIANNGEEWIPDWDNTGYKWQPWFYLDGLGGSSGFRFLGFAYWLTVSLVGSRLCFFNKIVGDYVVETFLPNYKAFFVIEPA